MFKNCPWLLKGRIGIFVRSKLGQNLSEMDVTTLVRIRRVICDHLLVLRLKLSRSKLYFSFRAEQLAKNNIKSSNQLCSLFFFSFVPVSSPPRSFFRLNRVKKVWKGCSHSRFSLQAIILGFFDWNVGLCCLCFLVAMGDHGYVHWVKQWREMKDQSSGKGGRTQIVQGLLQALLQITHTESLFAGSPSRRPPQAIRKQIAE